MSVLNAERIKLLSTRSPWWCALLAIALPVGLTALIASQAQIQPEDTGNGVYLTQMLSSLGRAVVMVMAALSVTSEYRFGTIRSTFQAVPHRATALLAKTVVTAVPAMLIGAVVGFGSWAVFQAINPFPELALDTAQDWRAVAGQVLVFGITAVLALGVGTLIRQTAGAVAVLLVYALLVEGLVGLIPKIGDDIQHWLPFFAADRFLGLRDGGPQPQDLPLGPWGYLAYFAAVAAAVLAAGILSAQRRDA
ncbi:hypothetical protein [Actinokineospora cianjurensis]|uniref:ABC-2 type transport system permease protein n=1 Tax=Actinokineospora cianjurensis TaxID=585224 RepID=A0A421B7J0_9PSEU|nr:hypothetical protein [Actinokineospora cianjurensis]RLK60268.1 ABC-2 type transport system permease protein [Actinokineospora cianjurensis]